MVLAALCFLGRRWYLSVVPSTSHIPPSPSPLPGREGSVWGWQPALTHCPPRATQTRCPGMLSLLPPTFGCLETRGLFTSCPGKARWEVPLLSPLARVAARGPAPSWGALQLHCGQQDLAHPTPNPLRWVWEALAAPGEMWNELGSDPFQGRRTTPGLRLCLGWSS